MCPHRRLSRQLMFKLKHLIRQPSLWCVLLTAALLIYVLSEKLFQQYQAVTIQEVARFIEHARRLRSPRKVGQNSSNKKCHIFTLEPGRQGDNKTNVKSAGCQRILPLHGSCVIADKIFLSEPPATCSHQSSFNFCQLEKYFDGQWKVFCNETFSKPCVSPLSVGTMDETTGELGWVETGTSRNTSDLLTSYIDLSPRPHFGFSFIRCLLASTNSESNEEDLSYAYNNFYEQGRVVKLYAEQLLLLPPKLKAPAPKVSLLRDLSVNVILVDSVSRQHFFRSLPRSVSALKEIVAKSEPGASVLDFQLVQAVRSRTFETLQALFSGEINLSEKPFGTHEVPPRPLNLSYLLGKFKRKGYETGWLEDLCYLWEWGIAKDLHFLDKNSSTLDTWRRMWKRLEENYVDAVDVTLAMCKILKENNVVDHFHGPDAVCYNGKHQHQYLLEYLELYQQTLESHRRPYFMFATTNVAHEDSGRRVQTLDTALSTYFRFAASLENTLTIVFSDHGNAYGSFMRVSQEARIELFHPFMIFIVPHNIAKLLGDEVMKSLHINTKRLISVLDLHKTLVEVIDPSLRESSSKSHTSMFGSSLFKPVSIDRTCDDIPRIMPNLCICQNFDTPVSNSTDILLFAYFAVGRLNDEIQRQLIKSWVTSRFSERRTDLVAFRGCERLELERVQNIRRNYHPDGTQTLKMDLHVQKSQIFFVAIKVRQPSHDQDHYQSELDMFDRITPYSKFSTCAEDIDLSLCVCNISAASAPFFHNPSRQNFQSMQLLPNFEILFQSVNSLERCLLFVTIQQTSGAIILLANSCRDKAFMVSTELGTGNQFIYFALSSKVLVVGEGMVVIGLLYSENGESWASSVKASFQVVSDLH